MRTWVIHQHQTSGLEWESAFLRAVAKRVADVKPGRLFLPLSSGYDSGAIHLALVLLEVPHDTYSIVGVESKREVDLMRQRVEFARRHAGSASSHNNARLITPSVKELQAVWRKLNSMCEPYTYRMPKFSDPHLAQPSFVPGVLLGEEQQNMLRGPCLVGHRSHLLAR